MNIDTQLVAKAKEKLGDDNALMIAEILGVADLDERNLKACCPFHNEDTPSFIYDKKRHRFHCFGCNKTVDIIDAWMLKGKTYVEAVRELFELTDTKYSFGMHQVREFAAEYRYPHDEPERDMTAVIDYWKSRGISEKTLDHVGLRSDEHGNSAFRYFDTNDVLTMVKYRPSRPIPHGENKMWCQKNADTKPLLFNINRINMEEPLLICEGEGDSMSAIEAGYINAVSVPFGAGNFQWIDEQWDWLDKFSSIIICGDNDEAGMKLNREASHRLGVWRTKVVELPQEYTDETGETWSIKDLNELLLRAGPEMVISVIQKAKETPIDSVTDISTVDDVEITELDGLYMGIQPVDEAMSRSLLYGSLNILTGVNGCVDCDTEFLSKDGWKRMDDYENGDEVLVFDENGQAFFEKPEEYIKERCDSFLYFRSPGVSQMVTPEHTMVFVNEDGLLDKLPAQEVADLHNKSKNGFQGRFVNGFEYIASSVPHNITNAEFRVQTIAVLMGDFVSVPQNGRPTATVVVKTKSEVTYIEHALERANVSYRCLHNRNLFYITFKPPRQTTTFRDLFWRVDKSHAETILKEVRRWRYNRFGYKHMYHSTNRDEAGYIQFLLAMLNRPTRLIEAQTWDGRGNEITEYRLSELVGTHDNQIDVDRMVEKRESVDGFKYCFTTSTGMFVTRRDGIINVTGNSGKSSFLSQLICQCLEQGRDAWLYSMELPNYLSKAWMQYCMAGPHHVITRRDERGKINYSVPRDIKAMIDDYWKGRIYIYKDGYRNTVSDVLQSMEESARRYGCKLFIIDNLTAMNIEANENNKWDRQNEVVTMLIDFAKKFDVAVILVIHPRKMEQVRRMSKMDVQGSGGMVDLAHRAFSLYRVTARDREGVPSYRGEGWKVPPIKADVILDVLKDRFTGNEGAEFHLFFDRSSMRFFTNKEELNYDYAWCDEQHKTKPEDYIWPQRCEEDEVPF